MQEFKITEEQWKEILDKSSVPQRVVLAKAIKILGVYIPTLIILVISVFVIQPSSYLLYLGIGSASITCCALLATFFTGRKLRRKRNLYLSKLYQEAENEFYKNKMTNLEFEQYLSQAEQTKRLTPKKKKSQVKIILICLGVLIIGFVLWGAIYALVDVFQDDPYDDSDDYDWVWAIIIFGGIPLVWSFISDASGAARYKTEVIMRADTANKLYIKNNSKDVQKGPEDKKSKLTELESMYREGTISKSEYEKAREKILGD